LVVFFTLTGRPDTRMSCDAHSVYLSQTRAPLFACHHWNSVYLSLFKPSFCLSSLKASGPIWRAERDVQSLFSMQSRTPGPYSAATHVFLISLVCHRLPGKEGTINILDQTNLGQSSRTGTSDDIYQSIPFSEIGNSWGQWLVRNPPVHQSVILSRCNVKPQATPSATCVHACSHPLCQTHNRDAVAFECLPNRDQMSYSACQIGLSISCRIHDTVLLACMPRVVIEILHAQACQPVCQGGTETSHQ
jgi:hypothetical protein